MAVAYAYLRPVANHTLGAAVTTIINGVTVSNALAYSTVDDPYNAVDDADYVTSAAQADDGSGYALFTFEPMPEAISISKVSLFVRAKRNPTGQDHHLRQLLVVGGTEYSPTVTVSPPSQNFTVYGWPWPENPDTSQPWDKPAVDALVAGVSMWEDNLPITNTDDSQMYLLVEYVAAPSQIEQARLSGAQRLWLSRRPHPGGELSLPANWADVQIGDDVEMSHPDGPHGTDEGWLYKQWQRRRLRLMRRSINLDTGRVKAQVLDLRATAYLTSLVETLRTDVAPGAVDDGLLRLQMGGGRAFTRASLAWAQAPEDGRVTARVANELMLQGTDQHRGCLLEPERTNHFLNASFATGALSGGWTDGGGSGVAIPSGNDLFDSGVSAYHAEVTANGVATRFITQTVATLPAGGAGKYVRISFDYRFDSVATDVRLRVQRVADGKYVNWKNGGAGPHDWSGASSSWGAVSADAWLTEATGRDNIIRAIFAAIPHEAAAGSSGYVVDIGVTAADAAGVVSLFHTQIEGGTTTTDSVTSRIHTTTATATRAADYLAFGETLDAVTWPRDGGTVLFEFRPNWDAEEQAPLVAKNLFRIEYSSGWMDACFVEIGGGLKLRRLVDSVSYNASHTAVLSRSAKGVSNWYRLACRLVGSEGDLDLTAWTLSLFVDGTKGTDVVAIPQNNLPSAATLYLGGSSTGTAGDGNFRNVVILPWVLTDDEIAAWRV